jgi:tetratricopeptide (TPR) repeat protein
MSQVFLSYSRDDGEAARQVSEAIERLKSGSVFKDMDALVAGTDFSSHIGQQIRDAEAVIVLLSRNSKRSKWVEAELTAALEQKKKVIPVLLDKDAKNNWVWPLISDRHAIERQDWESLPELAEKVAQEIEPSDLQPLQPAPPMPAAIDAPRRTSASTGLLGALGVVAVVLFAGWWVWSEHLGRQQAAIAEAQEALSREKLALAKAQDELGNTFLAQGDLEAARKRFIEAIAIWRGLADANPANRSLSRNLAWSYGHLGSVEARAGAKDRALTAFQTGREIIQRLLAMSPDNGALAKDLEWFDQQIAALEK